MEPRSRFRPPTHIVVLGSGLESPLDAAELLGGIAAVEQDASGKILLFPSDPARAVATFNRRFGLVIADLSASQAARLREDPRVVAVSSNAVRALPAPARQPSVTTSAHSWCLDLVGIQAGYSGPTGAGVCVAVLDSGISSHPDMHPERIVARKSYVASGTGPHDVEDPHGHGTSVAGVIGGSSTSSGGTRYGVAPECKLVIGRVLELVDGELCYQESEVIKAIDWATRPELGARIVCLSLWDPRKAGEAFSPHFQKIAERLLREEPGALLVAAAGNGSDRHAGMVAPVANPAACPAIVAVAAITDTCAVARASCGEQDAIGRLAYAAPGVGVHTAGLGGGFDRAQGTSFAAPHVVGIAALHLERMQAQAGGAPIDAAAIRQALASSVHPLTPSSDFGAGIPLAP